MVDFRLYCYPSPAFYKGYFDIINAGPLFVLHDSGEYTTPGLFLYGDIAEGTEIEITAIPQSGYRFAYWAHYFDVAMTGNLSHLTNPSIRLTITADTTVCAVFMKDSGVKEVGTELTKTAELTYDNPAWPNCFGNAIAFPDNGVLQKARLPVHKCSSNGSQVTAVIYKYWVDAGQVIGTYIATGETKKIKEAGTYSFTFPTGVKINKGQAYFLGFICPDGSTQIISGKERCFGSSFLYSGDTTPATTLYLSTKADYQYAMMQAEYTTETAFFVLDAISFNIPIR